MEHRAHRQKTQIMTDPELFQDHQTMPLQERNRIDHESPEAQAVLAEIRRQPSACDAIADRLGYPDVETRNAVRALETAGLIVDKGERIATRSYRFSVVWEATR